MKPTGLVSVNVMFNTQLSSITFQVKVYIISLLSNRQVFKAEHILKNLNQIPKYGFYQIAMEVNNETIKECIFQHSIKLNPNFKVLEEKEIHSNWILFNLLKTEENFDWFYKQNVQWRKLMAVEKFFENMDTNLINLLDKKEVWKFLLKNRKLFYLQKWIDSQKNKNESYDEEIFKLFEEWSLEEDMISQFKESSLKNNEIILNSLSLNGIFMENENVITIIKRMATSETLDENREILRTEKYAGELISLIKDNNLYGLLFENIISDEFLKKCPEDEFQLYFQLKNIKLKSESLLEISKKTSQYILKFDDEFYEKNPSVLFFEKLLENSPIEEFGKINKPQLKSFAEKLTTKTDVYDFESNLYKLVKKFHKIDIQKIQADAKVENQEDQEVLPHFESKILSLKYSQTVKLSYLHYIKQVRFFESIKIYSFNLIFFIYNYSTVAHTPSTYFSSINFKTIPNSQNNK